MAGLYAAFDRGGGGGTGIIHRKIDQIYMQNGGICEPFQPYSDNGNCAQFLIFIFIRDYKYTSLFLTLKIQPPNITYLGHVSNRFCSSRSYDGQMVINSTITLCTDKVHFGPEKHTPIILFRQLLF